MARQPLRPRIRLWLAALPVALVIPIAGSGDSRPNGASRSAWRAGTPVPIAVVAGRSRFRVDETGPGASTLVIVSALSRKAGPFPIRVSARGVGEGSSPESAAPPALADDGPRRAPSLRVPPLEPIRPPVARRPPAERRFHLLARDGDVTSARNYLAIRGTLRAVGDRVQVYVDEQDVGRVGADVLRDVVATFDARVFPVAARTIGQARDVDGDGRFTVLISSWLARLAGGRHAVDGFVRGADLDPELRAPFSNRCDMMYLNAGLRPGPYLRTVMAHEYTHAVTYTAKWYGCAPGRGPEIDEEGWLDEALAHLMEDQHGFSRSNLDYRISAFLSRPEAYRLVVEDYYAADLFRSHGNRGGTYLFLRWCADQYGSSLLPALVRSGRRGTENLEAATGLSFAALYREWTAALFLSGLDPSHAPPGRFRSLDVRAPIDGWVLAGPRADTLAPGSAVAETESWEAAGTSSRFLVVEPTTRGGVDIEVQGPAEAKLQVTAVPLPAGLARLDVRARVTTGADGTPLLHASVRESHGAAVRISALAWEPLVPRPAPSPTSPRSGRLDRAAVAASFGTNDLPARGRLSSRGIRLGGVGPGEGPLVIKVVGVDMRGRKVAGWGLIDPGHGPEDDPASVGLLDR